MSQYRIISICQRTISVDNCGQEGASLDTKQETVNRKLLITFNIKATQAKLIQGAFKTMYEFVLKQIDQDLVLQGVWFFCSCGNKKPCLEMA